MSKPSKKTIVKPLSSEERSLLAEHEFTISQGLAAFLATGHAIGDIREKKLHRETHELFKNYLKDRWGIGLSRAYQLMGATNLVKEISTNGGNCELIQNERQARALAGVPPHLREEVLDRVKGQGEKLTEQSVTRATIAILEEVREQAREQAERAASAVLSDDAGPEEQPAGIDEPEEEVPANDVAVRDDEPTPVATPTEATLRRAAKKVEKPRLYLARGLEHLRLALKDLRKLDTGDLATPDARQALHEGLSRADEVFSEARLLAKEAEEDEAA